MNAAAAGGRILFVDRDGTLIEEPPDQQVDRLDKLRFLPGVIPALASLRQRGWRLVMVTNQDGLGSTDYPRAAFDTVQGFLLDVLATQGIEFEAVFVCPHRAADRCQCRKPDTALVRDYLANAGMDPPASAMVGDRDSDLEFARRLGIRGYRVGSERAGAQTWIGVLAALTTRRAQLRRTTRETDIELRLAIADPGESQTLVRTGIGFFDHMLEQIARHGGFVLELHCRGDLEVDEHHTVEDCALALGAALRQALGDMTGVARYGFVLPMDESVAQVTLDLSGRPFASFSGRFSREQVGGLPTELVAHFFRSLAEGLRAGLHVEVRGENAHHMVEACFKGVGRALRQALREEGCVLPSTKGVL